jgi:type IV pilus assembly protein PilA
MQDLLKRLRKLRSEKNEAGFTLIELLVVVVIIGILIAIAIPLYLNYENGAKNKSSASDLRGAIATIEQCYSDNNNAYPTAAAINTGKTQYTLTGCTGGVINVSSGSSIVYNLATAGSTYSLVSFQGATGPATGSPWYCYNSSAGGAVKTETGAYSANAAGTPQTCP